jgi:hypothetical protein
VARHGRGKTAWRWEEESSLARALRALRSLQDQSIAAHRTPPATPSAFAVGREGGETGPNRQAGTYEGSFTHKHVKIALHALEVYESDDHLSAPDVSGVAP